MTDEMDEIWALYADDGAQALDAMETALLALGAAGGAEQAAHIAGLFRAVHTFKGNSRVLGLAVVESRAHLAEDLIGLVRDRGLPWTDEIRALLLETGDVLRTMLETTAQTRTDADPAASQGLQERLAACIEQGHRALGDLAQAPAPSEPPPPPVVAEPAPPPPPPPAPVKPSALADDPVYRRIFDGMVADARAKLEAALDAGTPQAAVRPVADLAHAARQLGLPDWVTVLDGFAPDPGAGQVALLLDTLADLSAAQAPVPAAAPAAPDPQAGGPGDPQDWLGALADALRDAMKGPDPDALRLVGTDLADLAAGSGLGALADLALHLGQATSDVETEDAVLAVLDNLVQVAAASAPGDAADDPAAMHGLAALRDAWSARLAPRTLAAFDAAVATLDSTAAPVTGAFATIDRQARILQRACHHHGLDTAAQLAMVLLHLFDRARGLGKAPDALLIRLARDFSQALHRALNALARGENPDEAELAHLHGQAAVADFTIAAAPTPAEIERRLRLPAEFHGVLSPDSTIAAAEAQAQGLGFAILRADFDQDDALAERFFALVRGGVLRTITNITDFGEGRPVFDFLIATALDADDLEKRLAELDPSARRLTMRAVLAVDASDCPVVAKPQSVADTGSVSGELLERIAELAAGQSMIHGMLSELVENDLTDSMDSLIRQHQSDPRQALLAMRAMVEHTMQRLREVGVLEQQLHSQVTELQQSTTVLRSRQAAAVLRPLLDRLHARSGRDIRISLSGGDLALDGGVLEGLVRILDHTVEARLAASAPGQSHRMHLSLRRIEDRLDAVLDDDDDPGLPLPSAALAELARLGGRWHAVRLPDGGGRLHLDLPLDAVVLEGMVVGTGGIRYVLPVESIRTIIQPSPDALVRMSVPGAPVWLRLGPDETVPVRSIGAPSAAPVRVYVVLGRDGQSLALPVDEVIGQQLVLLRPLRGVMARMRNVSGMALLAGGEVGMVLSPGALFGAGRDAGPDRLSATGTA